MASAWAASPLADPTVPPHLPAAGERPAAPARTQLQITRRGPGETMSAMLDGRWIRAGETFDLNGTAFRVERVTATSVLLARGEQHEVIEMTPQATRAVRCRDTDNRRSCR
jgi:hypothetical protein